MTFIRIFARCGVLLLVACTSQPDDPVRAVTEFDPGAPEALRDLHHARQALVDNPGDIAMVMRLSNDKNRYERYYLDKGAQFLSAGAIDQAIASFEQGLLFDAQSPLLLAARQRALARRQSQALLEEAQQQYQNGKLNTAEKIVREAASVDPDNAAVADMQDAIKIRLKGIRRSGYTIDLKFKDLPLKKAIQFVAETYGIHVIFDASVKDTDVSYDIADLPFADAIKVLTQTTRNAYKVIDAKTLLIFADTSEKRRIYDDMAIQTFSLEVVSAKDLATILKGVLNIKNITVNEVNNAIIVRDTPSRLALVEKIVTENDIAPGEVVLNVEILEVNTTKTKRLGIDYGNYRISTNTPALPIDESIIESYNAQTTLSLPSISLNAFKQAVDAKSLAKPSVRVLDGEKAKIHIGDRVPLRKSNIQDATGQTRTTFEYQEIGIRLNVEADVHSSDKVTVVVQLEVSSLGENLGTATEQAFRIGTRNADTTMLLSNGETAILGGLLREESRSTMSSIPGTDGWPYLRKLFGSDDLSGQQTDLLLTITPNIVRKTVKSHSLNKFIMVGSEDELGQTDDALDRLKLVRPSGAPNTGYSAQPEAAFGLEIIEAESLPRPDTLEQDAKSDLSAHTEARQPSALRFSQSEYEGDVGGKTELVLYLDALPSAAPLELVLGTQASIADLTALHSEHDRIAQLTSDTSEKGRLLARLQLRDAEAKPQPHLGIPLTIAVDAHRRGSSFITARLHLPDGSALSASSKIVVR